MSSTLGANQFSALSPGFSDVGGATVNAYVRVSASNPVTINYDYGVSSFTRNSLGNFTIGFTFGLANSNYTFFGSAANANRNGAGIQSRSFAGVVFNVYSGGGGSVLIDPTAGSWAVMGD